jgi:RNA ligase (TIGR02306 family)
MQLTKIVKITELNPIDGADRIERATVLGWSVVVRKAIHKVGDTVLFVFPDSKIPKKFLDESYEGDEKVRLKTVKMKGQYSAGLILPLSVLPQDTELDINKDYADILGIEKYEAPIPANLSGKVLGSFPTHLVSKTDELNYRSNPEAIAELGEERFKGVEFIATLKLDGTSATYAYNKQTMQNAFRVCSRNLELERDEENTYWKIAKQYQIEEKLKEHNLFLGIQGEIVGESIQGNPMKLKGQHFYVFLIKDLEEGRWLGWDEMVEICNKIGLQTVPVIARYRNDELPHISDLQIFANKLTYSNGGHAEGMVLRTVNPIYSNTLAKSWWSLKFMNEIYDCNKD